MKKAVIFILVFLMTSFLPLYTVAAEDDGIVIQYVDFSDPNNPVLPESPAVVGNDTDIYPSRDKAVELPSSYDSRNYGYVTPVKNQGTLGICWALAPLSVMEAYDVKHGSKTIAEANYSGAHLAWYGLNTIDTGENSKALDGSNLGENTYSNGGNWMDVTAALSNWNGINNEEDYPMYPYGGGEMGNYNDAEDRYTHTSGRILDSTVIFTADETDKVKQWIVDNGSIAVSTYRNQSLMSHVGNNYSYYGENTSTNHAVTIVGWDDNYSVSNFTGENVPASDGAWLIKDSWGTYKWDNGYFWLSYEDKSLKQYIGYTTRDIGENTNNYGYTSSYYLTSITSENSISGANVFIADGHEQINTVSFYTTCDNVTATVTIYKNIADTYTNPTNGTAAITFESAIDEKGFHTVEVPETVTVSPGERFSVCIQQNVESGWVGLPLESSSIGTYVSHEGESYYKSGRNWKSTSNYGYGNAYIWAATSCAHSIKESIVPSNCLEGGHYTSYCEYCSKVFDDYSTPVGDHTPENIPVVPSSCTVKGSAGGVRCSVCKAIITEPSELPLAEHDFEVTYDWSENAKTCTATAVCRNDDHTTITETVGTTGTEKTAAGCETNGTSTYIAEFENNEFTMQTKDTDDIPATGHAYGNPVFVWNDDLSGCSAVCTCSKDVSHKLTEGCVVTDRISEGQKIYTASVMINGKEFSDEKDVMVISSASVSDNEIVRGDYISWTFTTTTEVTWLKLSTSYLSDGTTKNLTCIYKNTNSTENVYVTDLGNTRIWTIRMKAVFIGDDNKSVQEKWSVSFKVGSATEWYAYDAFTPTVIVYSDIEETPETYEKYSIVSVTAEKETVSLNEYGNIVVKTTNDCDKVRISVNGKNATYQKTTKNVSVDTESENGFIIWTIRYRFTQSGLNEYSVSTRGTSWGSTKIINICAE